jgi:hypothetical protein
LRAGPSEAVTADAYAVAQRFATAEHEVEVRVRRVDNCKPKGFARSSG